ncbi:TetR/AcrR family transcriptional regulator [Herbiconiux sp. CPCC 205763]|uniref:TetR/AcrR family transcriptional regulator n=1 Tax=Herbiconiux aconitum TaxID=2970913 RepID=A0ABT2GNE7_9MICO|nr:TetR/AcrR family transcriptional regulator [Herbiconiux aconitum]MCS5717740.1 TetR/AcrR family transcriptional regulator [Herbiconiux aconitum]
MARPRKFQEADVIRSATQVFATKGYSGTTMDDLAAATGLGKQSIYNSFGGKLELFLRAYESDAAETVMSVDVALDDSDGSPLQKIYAHLIRSALRAAEGSRDSLFNKGTTELSDQYTEVAGAALKTFEEIEQVYKECLQDAQDQGELQSDANVADLAAFFLAFFRGIEALGAAGVKRETLMSSALTALSFLPLTELGRTVALGEAGPA